MKLFVTLFFAASFLIATLINSSQASTDNHTEDDRNISEVRIQLCGSSLAQYVVYVCTLELTRSERDATDNVMDGYRKVDFIKVFFSK